MPDLNRTQNFADGDLVTAQKLKDLIDLTTIQPYFLTSKTALSQGQLSADDQLLVYDVSDLVFKKVSFLNTQLGQTEATGRDYYTYAGIPNTPWSTHNIWAKYTDITEGVSTYAGIFITNPSPNPNGWTFFDGSVSPPISRKIGGGNINIYGGVLYSDVGQIQLRATQDVYEYGSGIVEIHARRTNSPLQNGHRIYTQDNEFYIEKEFTRWGSAGFQDGGLGQKFTRILEVGQVPDPETGYDTDDVNITLRDKLTVAKASVTEIDATTYKKSGASTIFPIKRGYSEYTYGSETTAYINIPDTVFNTGFGVATGWKLNAVASGGLMMWETTNSFSLASNEAYFLALDIWHNDLSTSASAYIDYRLRLKAKTVSGATYPMKEIAVRRFQVASGQPITNHRLIFRIERADFPTGGEDVTRQLQLQLTEGNATINYRQYVVRATAEVWNKSDITDGTAALL